MWLPTLYNTITVRNETQGCWEFRSFISDDLKIFSQPFERRELDLVWPQDGWEGLKIQKSPRAQMYTHGDT